MVSSWFYKYHLIELAGSFFTTWALMKASRMEPGNILTLVFFLFCLFFYHYVQKNAVILKAIFIELPGSHPFSL